VDTQGLLLGVLVHVASVQDADGAGDLLRRVKPLYYWLQTVFADSIYNRVAALLACFLLGITLIVVGRIPGTKGFVVLPRRWVVAQDDSSCPPPLSPERNYGFQTGRDLVRR
jgi:putative transposase